uniref:Uncharacterized protein n=1 Tax=Cannabis sativa TaxID=3483 RepID=A0A803PCG3_CANSA
MVVTTRMFQSIVSTNLMVTNPNVQTPANPINPTVTNPNPTNPLPQRVPPSVRLGVTIPMAGVTLGTQETGITNTYYTGEIGLDT